MSFMRGRGVGGRWSWLVSLNNTEEICMLDFLFREKINYLCKKEMFYN